MKVEEALSNMKRSTDMFRTTRVGDLVGKPERHLTNLAEVVSDLQERYHASLIRVPTLDIEVVWMKFELLQYDLSKMEKREQRALCVDPKTAVLPDFVEAALRHRDPCRRMMSLFGMVNAYFASWRSFPGPERMEELILGLVGSKRSGVRFLDAWSANRFLFGPEAANKIAQKIVRTRRGVHEVCRELYVDPTTALATSAREIALRLAVKHIAESPTTTTGPQIVKGLEWIYSELMGNGVQPGIFREAVSGLVVSDLPERYEEALNSIKYMVFEDPRLGDPRMPQSQANWRGMPVKVRERVLAWQARIYIDYFFNTLLPPRDENRRRADFWLKYVGKIKDFQVAVCDDDMYRLRSAPSEIKHYARMSGGNTSSFIMLFEGYSGERYIIIEFSEVGNAAYIFRQADFGRLNYTLRSTWFDRASIRRQDLAVDRILHPQRAWEFDARCKLHELGIRL